MDQNINLLEIIGRLYVQNITLDRQIWQLNEALKKETEDHKQLIELTNKLSMPKVV